MRSIPILVIISSHPSIIHFLEFIKQKRFAKLYMDLRKLSCKSIQNQEMKETYNVWCAIFLVRFTNIYQHEARCPNSETKAV